MKKRTKKKLMWLLLTGFLLFNLVAYNQAYRFTHFIEEDSLKTEEPEELNLFQKLGPLIFGINIPKPQNEAFPNRNYETLHLKSQETLEAWRVNVLNTKGTILLFHGYSGSKSDLLSYSEAFNEKGYSTFLVDFMGSGGSTGNRTTIGFKEAKDVKVAYDFIKEQNPNSEIILFGTSMGAVAIMKAIQDYKIQPKKIIIECPFGSLLTTTKKRFETMGLPSFPLAEILLFYGGLRTGFDAFNHNPTEYAKQIELPTLLLYGAKDERVTKGEIDEIFQNLKGEKHLGVMENSEHEVYLNDDSKKWNVVINDFLN